MLKRTAKSIRINNITNNKKKNTKMSKEFKFVLMKSRCKIVQNVLDFLVWGFSMFWNAENAEEQNT